MILVNSDHLLIQLLKDPVKSHLRIYARQGFKMNLDMAKSYLNSFNKGVLNKVSHLADKIRPHYETPDSVQALSKVISNCFSRIDKVIHKIVLVIVGGRLANVSKVARSRDRGRDQQVADSRQPLPLQVLVMICACSIQFNW